MSSIMGKPIPSMCNGCSYNEQQVVNCRTRIYRFGCYGLKCPRENQIKQKIPIAKDQRFELISLNAMLSMPFQSRLEMDEEKIRELTESVREHGVLEPVLLRPKPKGLYEVVAGERRLAAAQKADLTVIPAIVRDMTDEEAMECHLTENLQREDLSDYEKARMLNYMLTKFPEKYPTQEALAKKLGKTQQWISYHISMLKLDEDTITTRVVKPEQITERQARAILETPKDQRVKLAEKIKEHIETEGELPSARQIKGFSESVRSKEPPEATTSETPAIPESASGGFEPRSDGAGSEPATPIPEPPNPPAPETKEIDTGGYFTCPECGETFNIVHIHPTGQHKLKRAKII